MEYLHIGDENHGKTFLVVQLLDKKLTKEQKDMTVEKRFTEYIIEN